MVITFGVICMHDSMFVLPLEFDQCLLVIDFVRCSFVCLLGAAFCPWFGAALCPCLESLMSWLEPSKECFDMSLAKSPHLMVLSAFGKWRRTKTKVPIAMCLVFIYKSNVETIRGARAARMPGSEQWLSQATSRRWASTSVGEVKCCEGLCFGWTCVLSVFELMFFEWTCV